jgi:hypothetical protein
MEESECVADLFRRPLFQITSGKVSSAMCVSN